MSIGFRDPFCYSYISVHKISFSQSHFGWGSLLVMRTTFWHFQALFATLLNFFIFWHFSPLCFTTFGHFFAPSGTFPPHFLANSWICKLFFFYNILPLVCFFLLFGAVWYFLEHFGTFWHAIKIQKRPEIKDMAHLIFIFICVGPIWTILDQFGPNSTHLDPFALFFFTKLELFGNIWSSFELFGAFWSYLETFEAVWSQV